MKLFALLIAGILSSGAFASSMKCVGSTIAFLEDGSSKVVETVLKRVEGDGPFSVYYGESDIFKFWADHSENVISLEILDMKDTIVVNNPKMPVARFNVSIGSYWKEYFASLNCTPQKK